jgi:spermidine/putrescine ABC transporter ATP-binding subunit
MASVSLRSVSKAYAGTAAVSDVSLEVAEGEFVVLLGPSGCGKTTTLRMVAGFVQPSAGSILIGGDDVTAVPPRARNIGMVFQSYALFPNMSVAENIGFGLRERRVPADQAKRRVDELLELVQLSGRGGASVEELSGGQQQRVALARALAIRPRLLLMDEPLGALDLKLRESMQIELHRLQRDLKITTILVTHDQQEAMSLADRIVIMKDGRIQQVGSSQELYDRPANRFVAEFIGKNNLLRGRVVDTGAEGSAVRLAEGGVVRILGVVGRVGDFVDLSIRPESILLGTTPLGAANVLTGTVEDRRFLGNIVHYFVKTASGGTILVERPAVDPGAAPGEPVAIGWEPDGAVVFPVGEASPGRGAPTA